jgi:hypothetical protein
LVKKFKAELLARTDEYANKYELLKNMDLKLATVLDPKYKHLSFLNKQTDKNKWYKEVKAYMNNEVCIEESDEENASEAVGLRRRLGSGFSDPGYIGLPEGIDEEFESYLTRRKSTVADFYGNTDNAKFFPRLTALAASVFIIPATSVPCERLFSHFFFQVC